MPNLRRLPFHPEILLNRKASGSVVIGGESPRRLSDLNLEAKIFAAVQARSVHILANVINCVCWNCGRAGWRGFRAAEFELDFTPLMYSVAGLD